MVGLAAQRPVGSATRGRGRMVTSARGAVRTGLRTLRTEGAVGVARRATRAAYRKLEVDSFDDGLRLEDIADSGRLCLPVPPRGPDRSEPLTIGWVITPPALGSGGHTTLFRMVTALEDAGHRCVLFVYDAYDGDLAARGAVIRTGWPSVRAEIRDARAGITGVDACVATSWQTAHVLARRGTTPQQRFYFVQDFEPYFYARGSQYALAEDTYRMDLHQIALGRMVGDALTATGSRPDVVPFGCDTDVYRLHETPADRSGVVFYTRPGVDRRGYLLGVLALRNFHARHPEQPIHVYGAPAPMIDFPVIRNDRMTPTGLNELYNRSLGGLAMSFTNISLVAEEMLAAGCVPVVNDSVEARADLDNPFVRWADPTPAAISDALAAVVERPDAARNAQAAAISTIGRSWAETQRRVVSIIEDRTYR